MLHELIDGIAQSGNRFVLTSRYVVRTLRLLRDRSARFEVIHVPGLTVEDTLDIVGMAAAADAADAEYTARTVHALADGRPAYVCAIADELAAMRAHRGGDPMSALTSLLVPDGRLSTLCRFCYELRLHRARGYGALKAILDILGEEEGLTLTEIALRLRRTPGSTKDYLSWLEDVDLVTAQQKRYSFSDPLLRVWVRLHCRATAPSEDDLAREVHRYARPRLPAAGTGARDGVGRQRTVGHHRNRLNAEALRSVAARVEQSNGPLSALCVHEGVPPVLVFVCRSEFFQRQPGRLLLGFLLARSHRRGDRLALHHHVHVKPLAMIRPRRARQPVLGQRKLL